VVLFIAPDPRPVRARRHRRLAHRRINRGGHRAKTLLPVELAVDGNHDGVIQLGSASDQTTQAQPYRYWVNNNEDQQSSSILFGTSPDTVPPVPANEDYLSNDVVSTRDLEDWTRLWVYMKGLNSAIQAGTIQVGLKWVNTNGTNPGIKLITASDTDGGLEYLSDTTGVSGSNQRAQDPNDPNNSAGTLQGAFGRLVLKDANDNHTNIVPTSGSTDFIFPQWVWTNLSGTTTTTHFLFEGTSTGQGQLELVFLDQNGNQIGAGGSLWLDLRDVKEMYQRAIATGAGPTYSPPTEPYVSNSPTFSEAGLSTYYDKTIQFNKPWYETSQCVIFVHGWYTDYNQYLDYSETMFKRLWWQGYKGRFIAYNWPALSGASTYNPSEWNAWVYGTPFMAFVNYIKGNFSLMTVAAHSQGNVVVGSAIQQGLQFDNYIMMQAAIPTGCYTTADSSNDQYNLYTKFANAELVTSTPNLATNLGYRNYIAPNYGNVGNYYCFYNPNDFALNSGTYLWGWATISANWEADQVSWKPDTNPGQANTGFYKMISNNPNFCNSGGPRAVTANYESMSFVARPRSQAAGADPNSDAVFNGSPSGSGPSPYNLQATYGFGSALSDHSGQFQRDYNQVYLLYQNFEQIIAP